MSALVSLLARLTTWLVMKMGSTLVTFFTEGIHHTEVEVPGQLLKLVQQAHSGQPADLSWDIEVSQEMNDALCQPLTPEQLAQMRAAGEGVYSRSVHGYLISSSFKNNELSGVVQVSVTVHSRYSKQELSCPATRLRIVVSRKDGRYPHYRWAVTKVEQIA